MDIQSLDIKQKTPLRKLQATLLLEKEVELWIKQDYLTHPFLSGNKWRKLKYNLIEAKKQKQKVLLTFGGAYSNHIYAVAAAGKEFGFQTVGMIRGEEHNPLNHTLDFAKSCGMELYYLDRTLYRKKYEKDFLSKLSNQFGNFYLVPEGGTNQLALKGCQEMIQEIDEDFDTVCMPCGTGGTLAGSILELKRHQKALGFSALKGRDFLEKEVEKLIGKEHNNWSINWKYHFGGYAKTTNELFRFLKDFEKDHTIALDPIYTGKMFYGLFDLIANDYFEKKSKIVAIHTGGLQGIKGFEK